MAYMNHFYNTHMKVTNVLVNQVIIEKLIVHLINITSGVESEVTFVSIHVSSRVITLAHVLWLRDCTRSNIDNPF